MLALQLGSRMEEVSVNNLEELLQNLGTRKDEGGRTFLLFCGDIDETTGVSWCPDCVKGKPLDHTPIVSAMSYPGLWGVVHVNVHVSSGVIVGEE